MFNNLTTCVKIFKLFIFVCYGELLRQNINEVMSDNNANLNIDYLGLFTFIIVKDNQIQTPLIK